MRRLTILTALLVIVAACGSDTADTTTTSDVGPNTSTTPGSSSTSTPPASTTTTSPETTTTTEGTTTTSQLDGTWASEPLVVSRFGALGWWDGSTWIQVDETTPLPVAGGEDYQVVLHGLEAKVSGGPEVIQCDPLQNLGVDLTNPDVLGPGWPDTTGVAISAPWELRPHFVQTEDDDGTYSDFARPLLASRGLDVADPVIKQVFRFDVEGDGVNEVVAVAEDIGDGNSLFAQEGDYSLVFMRKVVEGEVQTAILADSVVAELEEGVTPFILSHSVAAIADLNGDEKMEIVLYEVYYEGSAWSVWEYVNDDLGPVLQIASGCGV